MDPLHPSTARAPSLARATLAVPMLAGLLAPPTPTITDCQISASAAYQYAVARGHFTRCLVRYKTRSGSRAAMCGMNPLPSGEISFFGKPPGTSYTVEGHLFKREDGTTNRLQNGWSVKAYAVTGAPRVLRDGLDAPIPGSQKRTSILFIATPSYPSSRSTFDVRLGQLVLTKVGGTCANVLLEAFGV